MNWKFAVGVEKEDITPPPPVSGVPIKPPVFPNAPQEVSQKVKLPKPEGKPSGAAGLEKPISDAVKEALEILKQIVENGANVIEEVQEDLEGNTSKIHDLKQDLSSIIESLTNVEDIAKDIQKMRVPERIQYESDQEYSDSLYNQIVGILDSVISGLESTFPEYQYNKSSITRFDEEGNILNGELRVDIIIYNFSSKVRFHLQVPVYIFNGYVQHPELFIFEGEKFPFNLESLESLVIKEPEYIQFEDGVHWYDQNKTQVKYDPKIPGRKEQKNYKKFDIRLNPIPTKPRFWNNFSADLFPDINNIKSSPTMYQDSSYGLY